MGIVVIEVAVFVDIKGYPKANSVPGARNAGKVEQIYGGVSRNVTEDIANCGLRPTFIGLVDNTADSTTRSPRNGAGMDHPSVGMQDTGGQKPTRSIRIYMRQVPDRMGALPSRLQQRRMMERLHFQASGPNAHPGYSGRKRR